ncbi:MAG: T9SS type A sorting domain-containing protein, partial [Bacteroidota bacterium]
FDSSTNSYQQASLDNSLDNFPTIPNHVLLYDGVLYLSSKQSIVYRSTDFGQSWTRLDLPYNVGKMYAFDGRLFFINADHITGRVYYTEDGFATHEVVDLNTIPRGNEFLDWWYFQDIFVFNDRLYIYQNDPVLEDNGNGLYYLSSTNSGWTAVEAAQLPAPPTFLLNYNNNTYAGIPRWSVWSDNNLISSTSSATSNKIYEPVYPNPTTDWLQIPNAQNLDWHLYDLQGRLLKFGNGQQVNLSNLAPGTYFFQHNDQIQQVLKVSAAQ